MQIKKLAVIISTSVLIVVVLVFAVIYGIKRSKISENIKGLDDATKAQEKTADAILDATKNPAESIPSTNPYEKVSNPYKDNYINPFSQ